MKVHIHDNHNPGPKGDNCLSEVELTPDKILTLHMHPGNCELCPRGHCHNGSINLVIVDGALFVVLEKIRRPNPITMGDVGESHHGPLTH